jgi:hypothetical protein
VAVSAERINRRAARDKAFLRRALANPGLRSKLHDKYLTPAQRAQRKTAQRLAKPIVPGSATTEGQLATESKAATQVRYGDQERELQRRLGISEQTERDTGSFYDQYRAQLQQHQSNVQAYNAGAQAALAQTAAGVTGLAGTEAQAAQQQANQGANARGVAAAGDLTGLASQALQTRQALMGGFQGQQAMQGQAANQYASTQANVVAPGQKLGALAQARGRTTDVRRDVEALAGQRGAFDTQYRSERRADEAKNVLAQSVAGVNAAAKATTARETARHHRATESISRSRIRTTRQNALTSARRAANKRVTSGPFAGMTQKQINSLSDSEAKRLIRKYDRGKGDKPGGQGPDWHTPGEHGAAMTQLTQLKTLADRARRGIKFDSPGAPDPNARLDRHEAAGKILNYATKLKDPILATAALDAIYDGRLSRSTVRKLIAAGYKPSRVMSTLGVKSGPTPRRPTPRPNGRLVGNSIPGFGGLPR